MNKEFKTSKGEFLAVLLPDDFDEIGDIETNISGDSFVSYFNDHEQEDTWIDLPKGNYEIIGFRSEITEEQAKEVVEKDNEFRYVCYTDALLFFNNSLESFNSLMQANEIFSENPFGEHPDNWEYVTEAQHMRKEDIESWDKAQENTGNYLILKKRCKIRFTQR